MSDTQLAQVPRQPMVYGAQEIVATIKRIDEVMKAVMRKDEHYGVIPGTSGKPTLLKAGAEKLCETFRLAPHCPREDQVVEDLGGDHRNYQLTVTLTHIVTGDVWGQGVGSCSTKESKYRWRRAGKTCPRCKVEGSIIKGKEEYGGGWLCWARKGGCGTKWLDGAVEIESQKETKTENTDPADVWNTCLKMAFKRAMVAATLSATAASDIFTQDVEDLPSIQSTPPTAGTTHYIQPPIKTGIGYIDPKTGEAKYFIPSELPPGTGGAEYIDPQTGEAEYFVPAQETVPPAAQPVPVSQPEARHFASSVAPTQAPLPVPGPAQAAPDDVWEGDGMGDPRPVTGPYPPQAATDADIATQHVLPPVQAAPPAVSREGSNPDVYPGSFVWTFGKHKGQAVSQLPTQYLEWVTGLLEKSLTDPAKTQYLDKNQTALAAVRAELAARVNPQAVVGVDIANAETPW